MALDRCTKNYTLNSGIPLTPHVQSHVHKSIIIIIILLFLHHWMHKALGVFPSFHPPQGQRKM